MNKPRHLILQLTTLLFLFITLIPTTTANPPFYRFTVGAVNATIISDGALIFDQNLWFVPENAVRRAFKRYFTPSFPFIIPQNVVILDLPSGDRVIVDTGILAFTAQPIAANAGKLIQNMKTAGIDPASINKVLLTHAHLDHFGGLVDAQGNITFPDATVYINRLEHQFASQTDVLDLPPPFPNDIVSMFRLFYHC